MDATPNLHLPYIMGAQAQKHVTHNEAIRKLDALVQLSVLDRDLTVPPVDPVNGDRYLVAVGATDAWLGHDLELAAFQDGTWEFYAPAQGWLAWLADENTLIGWDGTAWIEAGGTEHLNPASLVGINTTADSTNRLAVKSDAVLFSHDDATPGTGDHRTILNKAATGKTASFLFQSNWSGRAEIGLAGNDDFSFKVSPDGGTWHEALVLKRDGSAITAGLPVQHAKPPKLPTYTSATLPSAATYGAGSLIYVSDWPNGGATLLSDGLRWRRVSPRRSNVADILSGDEGIAIDFRARTALIDDYADVLTVSGRPADVLTLTRASDATYVGRDGLLATASSNALRYAYHPATREPRGLLLEGGATNLHKRSQALDTWLSVSEMAISADADVAPDGTATADLLIATATNTANHYLQDTLDIAAVNGTTYTGSVYLKAAGHNRVRLSFSQSSWGSGSQPMVSIDLATQTVYGSSASVIASSVVALGYGWFRVSLSAVAAASFNTRLTIWANNPDGTTTAFSGDGSSGFYAWGVQVEAGSVASSYIPTASAAVARAADSLTIGPNTFPIHGSGDCTLYWRGRIGGQRTGGASVLLGADDGAANETIRLREGVAVGGVDIYAADGGTEQVNTGGQLITLGADYAVAVSARVNDLKVYVNGAAVASDASLALPTVDRLSISPGAGSIYEIDEIAFIARARTASGLAALSTV